MPYVLDFCYSSLPLPDSRVSVSIAANSIPVASKLSGMKYYPNNLCGSGIQKERSWDHLYLACLKHQLEILEDWE